MVTCVKPLHWKNTDLIFELMKETELCCIGKNKLQFLWVFNIYFQTVFPFSPAVLLVLLLPNVGTRLHEATSPSLVVRRTLVLSHNHNHGLKMCILLKLSIVYFVQRSLFDPLTQQPGSHTPRLWQDRTLTMVKTTNHHLHHTLWSIHFVVIIITLHHLNNKKDPIVNSFSLLSHPRVRWLAFICK